MYEWRKRRHTFVEIADEFDCSLRTVYVAVSYAQRLSLSLTKAEDLQLLIDAKEDRINWIYCRLDTISDGVEWEEYRDTKDGRMQSGGIKIYPSAEGLYLREIRELEDDIAEFKGLIEFVNDTTDGKATDSSDGASAIVEALRSLADRSAED